MSDSLIPDEEPGLGLDLPEQPAKPAAASPYRVLARKYRPQSFAELIGQDAMVKTLANAIERGRIDDDMAGRAGHLPLAGAFQRLAIVLGDMEEVRALRRLHLAVEAAIGVQEPHPGHAAKLSWARAAASIRRQASTSSSSLV